MVAFRSPTAQRFRDAVKAGVFSRVNEGISSPLALGNTAAWYDVSDLSTLRNNAGAIPASGDGIKLVADKSGNSGVNCLVLNGVAGNNATAPDSVPLSITGDIDIRVLLAMNDWTPSAIQTILSKDAGGVANRSYGLYVNTNGTLVLYWSVLGDATLITATSTVAPTVADYSSIWVRVTLDVDNGSTQNEAKFYTSTDGASWTQLGTTVTAAGVTSIYDGNAVLQLSGNGTSNMFSGRIYRAQIYNGIAGTLAFDANFTAAAKLATSFTESSSNAATVTINTSGATGARISGERDLYQGTAANQPILTIAASGNYLTFDGTNDYLNAPAFSLSQPETVYFVGSQVTWTNGDCLWAGGVNGAGVLAQDTTTPGLSVYAGSTATAVNSGLALGVNGVVTGVVNGASSSTRVNRGTPTTGGSGSAAPNGFTIGGNGTSGATPANITFQEGLIRSVADATPVQDALILFLGQHNRIAV